MHEAYMTLEELGAALRAERDKRGLSIEDVANHLKIGPVFCALWRKATPRLCPIWHMPRALSVHIHPISAWPPRK